MTDKASYALLHGFGSVAIAFVAGYVLYKLIKTKDSPSKASDYGRNWMAWMAMMSTLASLPRAINNPSPDTIFAWIVPLIVFSAITFALGLMYGKFKIRKKSPNSPLVETTKQPNATLNNQVSASGINCSSCGAEITPKDAKFCKHCGTKVEIHKEVTGSTVKIESAKPSKEVASKTIKAESVKPPTIEIKIVDEVRPEKIPSEKKAEITAVYINEKPKKLISNGYGGGFGPGVQKNTKNNLILFFIFTILLIFIFSGSDNTKVSKYKKGGSSSNVKPKEGNKLNNQSEALNNYKNIQNKPAQLVKKIKYRNGKTTEYYKKNGYTWIELDYYEGWSKNSQLSGYGLIKLGNSNDTYEGELSDSMKNGKGIYTWDTGAFYDGEWKNNKIHGKGLLTSSDLSVVYIGDWENGIKHGNGIYVWPNGDSYDGEWVDGIQHGKGMWISDSDSDGVAGYKSYNGEWKNGRKHGIGVITLSNGYKGKARFENGQKVEDL